MDTTPRCAERDVAGRRSGTARFVYVDGTSALAVLRVALSQQQCGIVPRESAKGNPGGTAISAVRITNACSVHFGGRTPSSGRQLSARRVAVRVLRSNRSPAPRK